MEVSGDVDASLARSNEVRDAVDAFTSEAKLAQHLQGAKKKTPP